MEVMDDVLVGTNAEKKASEREKESRDHLLYELNPYETEWEKLQKTLLEKEATITALKVSLAGLERSVISLAR